MQDPDGRMAERQLVRRAAEGALDAFETLYRRHATRMKSVAANIMGNRGDAEDAVQEAFVRIHRGLAKFREESRFDTWAYRILVNVCHDMARKRRSSPPATRSGELEPEDLPRAPANDHPLRLALERALRTLTPRRRTAFVMFEVEGFKHREIAEIMGTSESNSKQMVFTAKKQLRELLSERGPKK